MAFSYISDSNPAYYEMAFYASILLVNGTYAFDSYLLES